MARLYGSSPQVVVRGRVLEHTLQKERVEDALLNSGQQFGREPTQAEVFKASLFCPDNDAFREG